MLELLTGAGLATSAGLNAALPLIVLGALDRWTTLVNLPASWSWLSNGWVLVILVVLLVVDVVADKIPGLDHVNDVVGTVVRPTAGGLAFGAGSGAETAAVTDPASFFTSHQWVPVAIGVVLALVVHGGKAAARPVVNATTLGVGGPVVSVAEDLTSAALAFSAVLLPILVLVLLGALVWAAVTVLRRRAERRRRRASTEPRLGEVR
ncbi:MAG TPA: DUF4126 domain-containing protein [Actinotalea sp.]